MWLIFTHEGPQRRICLDHPAALWGRHAVPWSYLVSSSRCTGGHFLSGASAVISSAETRRPSLQRSISSAGQCPSPQQALEAISPAGHWCPPPQHGSPRLRRALLVISSGGCWHPFPQQGPVSLLLSRPWGPFSHRGIRLPQENCVHFLSGPWRPSSQRAGGHFLSRAAPISSGPAGGHLPTLPLASISSTQPCPLQQGPSSPLLSEATCPGTSPKRFEGFDGGRLRCGAPLPPGSHQQWWMCEEETSARQHFVQPQPSAWASLQALVCARCPSEKWRPCSSPMVWREACSSASRGGFILRTPVLQAVSWNRAGAGASLKAWRPAHGFLRNGEGQSWRWPEACRPGKSAPALCPPQTLGQSWYLLGTKEMTKNHLTCSSGKQFWERVLWMHRPEKFTEIHKFAIAPYVSKHHRKQSLQAQALCPCYLTGLSSADRAWINNISNNLKTSRFW